MKAQSPNALTLLTARSKLLAKIVRPEGNQLKAEGKLLLPYRVDAETVPVDSLETLGSLLSSLASEPHRCIIRGALNGGRSSASAIRRLAYDDEKTGDKAQFEPVARAWVSFDLDDFPLGSVDPFDLEAVAALSRSLLPVEFHGAACAVQITTGHTIKPGNMGRVRPWFMLGRGVTEDELKRWFAGKLTGKQGGFIDASVWRTVQPNFTAAPVFEGCSDPLSARVVILDGEAVASVPELPEPVEIRPMPRAGGGGRIAGAVDPVALEDAKPVPVDDLRAFIARQCWKVSSLSSGRHEQLLATGRTLGGVLHYGAVPRHEIEAALFAAVEVSGYCAAYGEASARRAIASSLNNGAAAPIDLHKLLNLDRLKGSSIGSEAPRIEVDFLPVVEASARVMGSVEVLFSDARCWHNRREGLEDKAAPVHVLKATAGLGKSRAVRDAIGAELARGIPEDKAVYIFVPTHDLADEAQRAFALEYPLWPSMVFRGRSAKDPAGFALNPDAPATMCLQPDLAKEVSATGLSVRPHLCEGKGGAAWCRSGCRYLAQSEQGARVVFLSHQYLKHGIPEGMPPAWAVVIDENFERVGSTRITSEMLNDAPAFDFEDDDDAEALGVISRRGSLGGHIQADAARRGCCQLRDDRRRKHRLCFEGGGVHG